MNPNQAYLKEAYNIYNMGELGFIQLKEHYFMKCANPLEVLDFEQLNNLNCDNRIPIPDDFL